MQFLTRPRARRYPAIKSLQVNGMDSTNGNGQKPPLAGAAPAAGQSAEAYARWLEHMQRTRGRHAAITRNLYTWSNYKNWADKVKGSFEPSGSK
jgi:hypothetical protein